MLLTDTPEPETQPVHELVALFETRAQFDAAVAALRGGGFDRQDLSVLSSHQSLDAADTDAPPGDDALTALLGELKYAFPLTTAGLIAIVGGPLTASIAALVAAGLGGLAVKDYLDEITAHPRPEEFARALEAGGIILWVRLREGDAEAEATARRILGAVGGRNIHLVRRSPDGSRDPG